MYYYEFKTKFEKEESGNRLEVIHNSFAFC